MSANEFFADIKGNFGFGYMRLPMVGNEVDNEEATRMVDEFMKHGFNYFDTAHGYIDGKSELSIKECLTKRYPRDSYILTNKLTDNFFNCEEDIRETLNAQLEACGVQYFDFYLMHAQHSGNYDKYKKCRAYETVLEFKKEGKVRHLGISFHDSAEFLDKILTENPEIEVVQIQFNYLDYEDPVNQSRLCYEVCRKHNKPVIVMEPVRGGSLVKIPKEGRQLMVSMGKESAASFAIRYAASFPGVMMVLSGMSNMEQMLDNLNNMENFVPLTDEEKNTLYKVAEIIKEQKQIPCTACRYCVKDCPMEIHIPELFKAYNENIVYESSKASNCIKCGKCEEVCPQHLEIRKFLEQVTEEME